MYLALEPENIWELSGNLNYFQCEHGKVFLNNGIKIHQIINIILIDVNIAFNEYKMEVLDSPTCKCNSIKPGIVRPNILMFNDA